MSAAPKFEGIHEAMLGRGFKQAGVAHPLCYTGTLPVGSDLVPVSVEFYDLELQTLPTVRLTDRPSWVPPDCNHITAQNTVCYANSKLAFIDRYDAARQVLYCVERAAEVLRDIRRGNAFGDVDHEFAWHWRGQPILIDAEMRDDHQTLKLVTLKLSGREIHLVCGSATQGLRKYAAHGASEVELSAALLLRVEQTPSADTKSWPPRTLQQTMQWLSTSSPQALQKLRRAFGKLINLHVRRALVVFQACPTSFAFAFELPAVARVAKFRSVKNFVNAIMNGSAHTQIERLTPFRIDSEYLVERNLRDDERNLLGQRVLLVGAGAIGGHIAHALGRVGAGFGGGSLTIVDPDQFTAGNIGRHRLGIEALIQTKAEALAQDLSRSLPGVVIRPVVGSALDLPLKAYDLIVDATGEEQLSEALNARYISGESAPTIFVWINGNGTSAQSFTLAGRDQGCLHCWKCHGSRSDFVPSSNSALDIRIGRGCDDPYAPFNSAASLAAAGLAVQAIIDWASGRPAPTLRAVEVDYRATHHVKPKSPAKASRCPACGPPH